MKSLRIHKPFYSLRINLFHLDFNFTVNGLGAMVIPSTPSIGGNELPSSYSMSKECIKEAKNINRFDLAKFSPMHFRRPGNNSRKNKTINNSIGVLLNSPSTHHVRREGNKTRG